jgi:hypothetical protein
MTQTTPTIFLTNTIESAGVRIFQCQKQWDELQASGRADVRLCDHCHQEVHRVVDSDGFQRAMAQGQCVMMTGYETDAVTRKVFVGQPGAASYETDTARPVQGD